MTIKIYNSLLKWGIAICSVVLSMAACNKAAEDVPLETVSITDVFNPKDSLGTQALKYLYDMYTSLPEGYNRVASGSTSYSDVLDAGSDDAIPSGAGHLVEYFSTGMIDASNLPDNTWSANYSLIRKANIFLQNIDVVPLSTVGLKDQWKGEARFLRAIAYFELIKRWGGVPLVGDKIFEVDEKITLSRNSYDDCVDYIVKQLDTVMTLVPTTYATAFYGRITKGAAMALKAKTLLYAASPLHNAANDISKWTLASNASKALIDSNIYALVSSYANVFSTRSNTEVILAYMAAPSYTLESLNGPVGSSRGDLGLTSPTQELVDEFEMSNGKAITDPESGYSASNPYTGRDPRLALTVFYNGLSWLSRTVQTYDGGIDRPQGYNKVTSGETRTGYYMRKMLSTSGSNTAYANAEHCFPIIRYAEVLLDYAEAENEVSGPTTAVYNAIQLIRQRAGLSPYALTTGLTQAQMRECIRHERRVELAFEEQRFWDIRRWDIAKDVLNGTLHGMQITLNSGAYTYNIVPAVTTFFDSRLNLYPIPFAEIAANPNLLQNPNW
ncbi:MAG: RagB/SusD family nutrient uptake outer membrane protein [Niabella sp.]